MPVSDVDVTPPPTAQHVFIARQPIFDARNKRVAYELLYRANQEATHAGTDVSPALMCGDTALHALLSIGLDRLTGGTTAFVNVTEEHLTGELYKIFDPKAVVLELLESIDGTPAVVDACARAVADGYVLALDDYDGRASLDALLPYVSIVKVDVLPVPDVRVMRDMVQRLRAHEITVLAERVETPEVLQAAREVGFELFQGYVFSKPETLDGRAVNVQQATVFHIMALLNEPDATDTMVEEAFRSHPSLSLSLLRIVNSASFGGRGVDSIPYAIRLVGREALSRWMLIMLVASVGSRSAVAHEAVVEALVRGRFCEVVTAHGAHGDPAARFLVGLLSRMDRLLGLPMEQVLERLPVSDDVRDALLHARGPHATVLLLADAYENADWPLVDTLSGNMELPSLYAEAVQWANTRLAAVTAR
ncbi:MAG: EAL domain-containing protein [Gemmatimonadaceae bacterium]|nr:EAL domain-containing protein [Gemmatimonadaceae bacterium]